MPVTAGLEEPEHAGAGRRRAEENMQDLDAISFSSVTLVRIIKWGCFLFVTSGREYVNVRWLSRTPCDLSMLFLGGCVNLIYFRHFEVTGCLYSLPT